MAFLKKYAMFIKKKRPLCIPDCIKLAGKSARAKLTTRTHIRINVRGEILLTVPN